MTSPVGSGVTRSDDWRPCDVEGVARLRCPSCRSDRFYVNADELGYFVVCARCVTAVVVLPVASADAVAGVAS